MGCFRQTLLYHSKEGIWEGWWGSEKAKKQSWNHCLSTSMASNNTFSVRTDLRQVTGTDRILTNPFPPQYQPLYAVLYLSVQLQDRSQLHVHVYVHIHIHIQN